MGDGGQVRHGLQLQSLWIIPIAAVRDHMGDGATAGAHPPGQAFSTGTDRPRPNPPTGFTEHSCVHSQTRQSTLCALTRLAVHRAPVHPVVEAKRAPLMGTCVDIDYPPTRWP